MSERPFMQLYVADYLGDTMHLSTEQHGAYLLLLMTMWRAGGRLPNDEGKLSRIVGLSPARWRRIAADVMAFFTVVGSEITQKRLAAEIEKASEKSLKRAHAGSLGGRAKSLKTHETTVANATVLLKHLPETRDHKDKKEHIRAVAKATRTEGADEFQEFWNVYPKRDGGNPKKPAAEKFYAALKGGTTAAEIIAGAKAFSAEMQRLGKVGTAFVPMAKAWLHQQQWGDYAQAQSETEKPKWQPPPGAPSSDELRRRYSRVMEDERVEGSGESDRDGEGVLRESRTVRERCEHVGVLQSEAGQRGSGSVGPLFRQSSGVAPGRSDDVSRPSYEGNDGADAVAPMVRFGLH